jgi:hypothetical protein
MFYMQTNVDRRQLNLIPITKRNNVSDRWKGVQHGQLATAIVKQAQAHDIEITKEQWYCNPDRTDLYGAIDLTPASVGQSLDGIGQGASFSLGVRHSNLGKYAVSFAVGARISVCSNGLFSGEFILKHRHTLDLDLNDLVSQGIKRYIEESANVAGFITDLQDITLTDGEACSLILRSKDFISFRYLEDVHKNWVEPPHQEFEPRTAWSLYNAYSETMKVLSPPRQAKAFSGLNRLFDQNGGLTASLMQAAARN